MNLCTRCHKEPPEWDFGDDKYCQMCFEAVTSEAYWEWYDSTKGLFCMVAEVDK